MLHRIWQWLRQRWQRWFDRPSVTQPVKSKPSRPVRGDTEYEAVFMRLLEGINQGWGRGDVQGFLFANALSDSELAEWLHRFGNRLLESSAPNQELADRLAKLGALRVGAVSQGAIELAHQLRPKPNTLPEPAAPVPAQPTHESSSATTDEAEAYVNQGIQKGRSGDHHGALNDFDHAIQLNPKDHNAWYNRGNALAKLERHPEAIDSYDHAIQLNPKDHQAWYNRGNALQALERYPEAIDSYDHALKINPKKDEAWYNRGVVLHELERYEAAIDSYDHAIQLNPKDNNAWGNRGNALAKLERHPEAIDSYDHAIQLNPKDNNAWYNRGLTLKELERLPEAIDSYDHAIQLNPKDHQAWYNRGNAVKDLERYPEAIDSYDHALKINPKKDEAWYSRGVLLARLERLPEAIESYDHAIQLNPKLYQAWIGRGNSVGKLNHETISPMLAISQQNSAMNQPGYFGKLANYEEGLRHVERDSDPEGWGWLHRAIGFAHYVRGKYEPNSRFYYRQAVQSYYTALETLTEQAFPTLHLEVLQNLIRACLGLNDREAANHWRLQGLRVLRELINQQSGFAMRRRLEAKFSGFSQIAVDVLVQDRQIVAALEAAERYKNRCLTWILEEWQEQVVSPSYTQMRQLLNAETAIVYYHLSPDSLTTFVLKLDAPEPIVIGAIGVGAVRELPLPESRQQFRAWETWLKDWNRDYQDYRGKKGEKPGSRRDHAWRKNLAFRLERLKEILQIGAIESALSGITQLILIPHRDLHRLPLHGLFSDRFTVTYLPSVQVGRTLQHHHPVAVEAWQDLRLLSVEDPKREQTERLLSVEDPKREQTEALKFGAIESHIINTLFSHCTHITPEKATLIDVSTALQQPHQIFHFTGHADYNYHQPENSALGLVDGLLTAETIRQFDLSHYQLVSLSACETAVTGNQTIESDYVGLVSAFLQAGSAHVVSTLWTVNEISNAWLMIRFYQELLAGKAPALALKQAQRWLREIDRPNLAAWLLNLSQLPGLDSGYKEQLEMYASVIEDDNVEPFSRIDSDQLDQIRNLEFPPYDEYHWAAFTLTGKVAYSL